MKVAIVLDRDNDIIHVTTSKKKAKQWLQRVATHQHQFDDEFDDHWWMDVDVDECTVEVWEVC